MGCALVLLRLNFVEELQPQQRHRARVPRYRLSAADVGLETVAAKTAAVITRAAPQGEVPRQESPGHRPWVQHSESLLSNGTPSYLMTKLGSTSHTTGMGSREVQPGEIKSEDMLLGAALQSNPYLTGLKRATVSPSPWTT